MFSQRCLCIKKKGNLTMKYSRSAIKQLTKWYKQILIKCAVLNAAILAAYPAYAIDRYETTGENYSYNFDVYGAGESVDLDGDREVSPFNVQKNYLLPLMTAAQKWASVIKAPNNLRPLTYFVLALDDYNASAGSIPVKVKEGPYKVAYVNAAINGLTDIPEYEIPMDGFIFIGHGVDKDNPGWAPYSGLHALNHSALSDMHTVMLHEFMHSLGISTAVQKYNEDDGDDTYYFTEDKDDVALSIFDKDLRIYTGDTDEPFKAKYEIMPQIKMSVGDGEDFDVYAYSPYYVGENTIKVLAGEDDYDKARQAIIKNGGLTNYSTSYDEDGEYPQVYGMPIHNADDDEIDLSHLELKNSYMSHQEYRNWMVPMEAELAVLKDLGYDIELREYFGKSYYLNNVSDTFTTGYSQWDGSAYTGAPSTKSQGVGLHIYGNKNNIVQAADISSVGEGAIGVRIDGVGNKYTLKSGSTIKTNGVENLGLAVTWGKDHIINIENGASIVATGKKGVAASFDFGANIFGTTSAMKGSYINYDSDAKYDDDPSEATDSALVYNFNVAGSLEGSAAAIYISDNAHVKNINIMDGAHIKGDIISAWNSVSAAPKAHVQTYDGEWRYVDSDDTEQIYFTNLNIFSTFVGSIDGNINGDNEVYNTLKLNNEGDLTIGGNEIFVYTIQNTGVMNLDSAQLSVANGEISGDGVINVQKDLTTSWSLETVENTINMAKDSEFSTVNDEIQTIKIAQLNTENTKISFDLGDEYDLQKASAKNSAFIGQVQLNEDMAKELSDNIQIKMFSSENVLDLGDSAANVYYDGNRYALTQSAADAKLLDVKMTAQNIELADAAEDETAANYIVTEARLTKDAGTVKGQDFEISGADIDINGHKGVIVDKTQNSGGTVLKTSIYGASDSALSLVNGGSLIVDASADDIIVGAAGETALSLNNGSAELNAAKNSIRMNGDIVGTDNETDLVKLAGDTVVLNKIQDVNLTVNSSNAYLNNTARNTVLQTEVGTLYVLNDAYLAADGSNKIIGNGGTIYLANDETTEIPLSQLVLNTETAAVIDIDLQNKSADRFVFENNADVQAENMLFVAGVNLVNANTPLADKEYRIVFVDAADNGKNLLGRVAADVDTEVMSPVFKYTLAYEEDAQRGAFVLSRGSEADYDSYNPAVTVSAVAAQLGGYLAQINAYNQAFGNLDMQMLPIRTKTSSAAAEGLSSGDKPALWRNNTIWLNPFTSFEKVDLKRGPKVRNNMYGAYAGDNSQIFSGNGWDYQYAVYAGYNGSRQRYDGNLIRQNGGTLGVTGAWYKNNFFTALTANIGANYAKAYTAYGHEHFETLLAGVASKTGYNWQLSGGKYVIQPSYTMSYTFVDTLNYKNAAGVGISADAMHVVNLAPELKAILNLQNGWQPYARAQMAWNIFDKSDFQAQNVNMPEMSVKPYVEYGAGLQKRWGEKISAYGEVMRRDGGRDGIAVQAGFSWAFGK